MPSSSSRTRAITHVTGTLIPSTVHSTAATLLANIAVTPPNVACSFKVIRSCYLCTTDTTIAITNTTATTTTVITITNIGTCCVLLF